MNRRARTILLVGALASAGVPAAATATTVPPADPSTPPASSAASSAAVDLEAFAGFLNAPDLPTLAAMFAPDSAAWTYGRYLLLVTPMQDLFAPNAPAEVDGDAVTLRYPDGFLGRWTDFQLDGEGKITDLTRDGTWLSDSFYALDAPVALDEVRATVELARYVDGGGLLVVFTMTNDSAAPADMALTSITSDGTDVPDTAEYPLSAIAPGETRSGLAHFVDVTAGGTLHGQLSSDGATAEFEVEVPPAGSPQPEAAPTAVSVVPTTT